jgi:hypothetical protein
MKILTVISTNDNDIDQLVYVCPQLNTSEQHQPRKEMKYLLEKQP